MPKQAGLISISIRSDLIRLTAFQVHDLLGEGRYLWQGARNYVELIPESLPAHILHVRRWVRKGNGF